MVETEGFIDPSEFPINEDLERFKPPYTPEVFTDEEKEYLLPFFTNLDQPVFIAHHLPEIVIAALSARYSRSTKSVRRMFLDEYVAPVAAPQKVEGYDELSFDEKEARLETAEKFRAEVAHLNETGGIDGVVNAQRATKFFNKWLDGFGDDSIAELGNVHLFVEGASNIAVNVIEAKRVGISPLEKSSRYVSFLEKGADGHYQYVVPGEIIGTHLEGEYREAMDNLFDTFAEVSEPYLEYIKELYPQGEDEPENSFKNSRAAKRFDDLRDLLPFATRTNVALSGNGRAYEDLVNKMLAHPLGEVRYWGQAMTRELDKVVPSFVSRPQSERGAKTQKYLRNLNDKRGHMATELLFPLMTEDPIRWARLLSYTQQADMEILSAWLLSQSDGNTFGQIREMVSEMSPEERSGCILEILEKRNLDNPESKREQVRFNTVPRSFENAHYTFEVFARGGDYRDLHRHRQQTQERHPFTNRWGYDLEQEVNESPFVDKIKSSLDRANTVWGDMMLDVSDDVAQYAVPFANIQHWYMHMSAKEIYWIVELRTGPQGRPHYREICQQIADLAIEASPAVFQGMRVDRGDYSLARRESEIKAQKKRERLEGTINPQ